MELCIDTILEEIKNGKSQRTQNSLDHLNQILETYHESGKRDFSVTTIGRISSENGGVGYQAIRATRNIYFRQLIEAWAAKANTTTKKPLADKSRSRHIPKDFELLERIADPALRAVFGQIIAERNRYRQEVNILKQHTNIIIDRRPYKPSPYFQNTHIELTSSLNVSLTTSELKALNFAATDECLEQNNWQVTQAGQVKDIKYMTEIFPRGFMTALKKILCKLNM